MARLQGAATTPKAEVSLRKVRLQGFAPNKGCRYPARRGLNPSHQTLLLGSSAEIGQLGAPQTPATAFGPPCQTTRASPRGTRQPQSAYPFQNRSEELAGHRHLRQLEDDVLGVRHDLRPDLDQLLAQGGQVP